MFKGIFHCYAEMHFNVIYIENIEITYPYFNRRLKGTKELSYSSKHNFFEEKFAFITLLYFLIF